MQIAQMLRRFGIAFLILLSIAIFACNGKGDFEVKSRDSVNVGDQSLSEWDSSFIVLEITPQNASQYQRKDIPGEKPDQVGQGDFGVKVYMARDNSYWYIAFDATDDKVIPSITPYSGDSLEVFFAGKHLDSPHEMSTLVASFPSQAALFQLVLPAYDG